MVELQRRQLSDGTTDVLVDAGTAGLKVYVVNPPMTAVTEEGLGSDCSGSDGATNRVWTLGNSSLSSTELIFLDGVCLDNGTQYTVSHLVASTTITFLIEVWDDQKLKVLYFT